MNKLSPGTLECLRVGIVYSSIFDSHCVQMLDGPVSHIPEMGI